MIKNVSVYLLTVGRERTELSSDFFRTAQEDSALEQCLLNRARAPNAPGAVRYTLVILY